MPELPDITVYVEALESHVVGKTIERVRVPSVSLMRTAVPPIEAAEKRTVERVSRMGKRIVFGLPDELHLVLHLMIAGRLHWKPRGAAIPKKRGLAAFEFSNGTLLLTEAGSRRLASLHVVQGQDDLHALNPCGLEVLGCPLIAFQRVLTCKNHTLKRALTLPVLFSGIGGAYSDEIMHRAKVSPLTWTTRLSDDEVERLWKATNDVLVEWTERLRGKAKGGFPKKVTAFHPEMAVHGKFKEPCPDCGAPVQRIVYASRETNYCAPCQTGGKVYADRAMSQLLKDDWPRSIEAWEAMKGEGD